MTEHCSSKWFVRTWDPVWPEQGSCQTNHLRVLQTGDAPFKPIPWLNLCIWTLLRLWKSGWYSLLKGDTTEPCWSRICRLLKCQQILTTFASSIDYGVGPFMDHWVARFMDLNGATSEAFHWWTKKEISWCCLHMGVSENSVPLNPMVLLIIIPIKWLFHWEYTLFSDKPIFVRGANPRMSTKCGQCYEWRQCNFLLLKEYMSIDNNRL